MVLMVAAYPFAALAQTYGTQDAHYVTNSRNDAVLRYIVCLELVAGTLPSSMSLDMRMARAEADCQSAAARLPNSAREPDVADIRGMILECGFRPGEASPDADCGAPSTSVSNAGQRPGAVPGQRPVMPQAPARPLVADEVDLAPRVIELGKWIEGVAHDGADLWAAESGQRTMAKVDYRTGKVIERFNVGRLPIEVIATGSGDVYTLVATDKVVLRHDRSGKKSQLAKLKACPSGMRAAGSDLFVLGEPDCSSASSQLVRIDTKKGTQKATADLGEWSTSLTPVGNDVWVGHARGTALSIVDRSTLKSGKLPLPGIEVWTLASNSSSVFAGGRYENTDNDGSVVMVDARSRREVSRFSATELVTKIAADDEKVVAVGNQGTVWILSADDLSLVRTIRLSVGAFNPSSVSFVGSDLVISTGQYRGENGAVFVLSGYMPQGFSRSSSNDQAIRPGTRPAAPGQTAGQRPNTPNAIGGQRPSRPTAGQPAGRPNSGQQAGRPSSGQQAGRPGSGQQAGSRPARPGSNPASTTPRARPGSEFPILAGSLGGNIRAQANISATKIASTNFGQPITLLRRTNKMLDGYPWFAVRLGNGDQGFQWGGIICANRKPISGTKEICAARKPSRPSNSNLNAGSRSGNGQANTADVIVGVLDLFGKIIDSQNQGAGNGSGSGRNADIFRQRLNVTPDTGGLSFMHELNQNQLALFTVRGAKGQKLNAELFSDTQNAAFEIYINNAVKGGRTLPGAGDSDYASSFEGQLPVSGDYQIVVGSTGGRSSFELVVALQDPVPTFQNAPSAGTGNSQLVAGTYTSQTGSSGNIFLNDQTGALTWQVFCGGSIPLTPDWNRSELVPQSGQLRPFRLDVRGGKVVGFRSGQDTYVRQDNVMMPGCAPAPGNSASSNQRSGTPVQAADWTLAPQDPRESKDYSGVPNAYWAVCESANLDPNSPVYNNEKAYWDCADEGLRQAPAAAASGQNQNSGTANQAADWTLAPQDPRESKDYSGVPNAYWAICESANLDPNSPAYNNEKAFWDCADEGLRQAAAATGSGPSPAGVPTMPDGSPVPNGLYQSCALTHGENTPAYDTCVAQGIGGPDPNASGADGQAGTSPEEADIGNRGDYSALPQAKQDECGTRFPDSPLQDKEFYGCMNAALDAQLAGTAPAAAPLDPNTGGPDPNASGADGQDGTSPEEADVGNRGDYSALPQATQDSCGQQFPDSPLQDKEFYGCMNAALDAQLAGGAPAPTTPATGGELNPGGAYSDLADAMLQACQGDTSCLDNARAVVGEFSDLTIEDLQNCSVPEGYGGDPFFNCVYALRDSRAAGSGSDGQAPVAVDLNPGGAYGDLGEDVLQACQGDIGCLDNARGQIEENNRLAIDNRVASEFSDLDGEEIQGCATYGYGSNDFFNCLYAVRDSKAQQNAPEPAPVEQDSQQGNTEQDVPSGADQQTVLSALTEYCTGTYSGDQVGQCEQVLSQCVYGYTDYESAEFNQCVQGSGW